MKIVFTKHAAVDKVAMLKKHNFTVSKAFIKNVIDEPEDKDTESDFPKIIASKAVDEKHVLRVVYKRSLRSSTSSADLKKKGDIITVITFYPAAKGRYY